MTRVTLPSQFNNRALQLEWADEFERDGPVDAKNWRFERMEDGLHRAGNEGMDRNGNIAPGQSAKGHRWAAEYDQYNDELAYVKNGQLVMKGKAVNANKPTRINWTLNGQWHNYGDTRLYSVWLDTWARLWAPGGHVVDPASPGRTIGPGSYIETRVDFSQKCVPGHRSNLWLMPAEDAQGKVDTTKAYDKDVDNGLEIDIFEHDVAQPHLLLCKAIGGGAGNTPGGAINARKFGIDLMTGSHTIALLWESTGLYWFLDGQLILTDLKRAPQVQHFLIMAREMNSGVKDMAQGWTESDKLASPPYIPSDPGLFAVSVIENVHKLDQDEMRVNYVRVFKVLQHVAKGPCTKSNSCRIQALRRRVKAFFKRLY